MPRHPSPALICAAAAALTVAMTVAVQLAADARAWQQQGQQPPPPITGGGQSTGGTGITQGPANVSLPPNLSDTCAKVPQAQADFIKLKDEIAVDQQILHNLGFDRNVDDIESWEQYAEETQKEYAKKAHDELIGKLFQWLSLKAEANATPPNLTPQKAVSLYNLFKAGGIKDKALFDALAATGRGESQIPEAALWVKISKGLEQLNDVREVIQTRDQAMDIFNSMLTVAGWLAPELAPQISILKDATWIGYATYTHGKVALGRHEVDRITSMTEAQLEDLQKYSQKFKQDVDRLNAAKKILESAKSLPPDKSCDSTNLAKQPTPGNGQADFGGGSTLDNPKAGDVPISGSPTTEKTTSPKHHSNTGWVVGGVLAGAGAAGAAAYELSKQNQSCGNLPGQCDGLVSTTNACGSCTSDAQCGGGVCFKLGGGGACGAFTHAPGC